MSSKVNIRLSPVTVTSRDLRGFSQEACTFTSTSPG